MGTQSNNPTMNEMYCEICLDEDSSSTLSLVTAVSCGHAFCRPCWTTWLEQCEQQHCSTNLPKCPKCRTTLPTTLVEGILQRPFAPRQANDEHISDRRVVEEEDEFTKTALQEMGARPCPNCAVPIVKVQGCCAMQCLCGQRFCFTCLAPRGCEHVLRHATEWYDNITGLEHADEDRVQELANPAELQHNLRNYLERTRRNESSKFWQDYRQWVSDLIYLQAYARWRLKNNRFRLIPRVRPASPDFPENVVRLQQQSVWNDSFSDDLELQVRQAWQRQALVDALKYLIDNVMWRATGQDVVSDILPSTQLRSHLCRQEAVFAASHGIESFAE